TDYFSPEMDYAVSDPAELDRHLPTINALLARAGQPPLARADIASGQAQLKCLIDLCHLNGIAVIFDVVYNHAGGNFDDRSIAWYDRQPQSTNWSSDRRTLYFGNGEHAGGLIFNYADSHCRHFLIDNAGFRLASY